ncbi:sugar ABC transporter permease [Granulicatella adiacens ATCC 49175]|jgi:ABC superfamily ATP binding cassette transporter, permease protein|uniref:ABC transporter, permease protein n=1 Tax=Granulicatella adiacens ATCC 49175 TaxID=638301 RepID=C8NGM4_9LACT|nr:MULTISPECIES: sugar ABC transporter permease [Granulicatella]MBF1210752.1 sugar ABC transporter permease [Granulicatella sp.]EEW36851.1 ABC transporter, permease protein [Granulicatella adiacens ATCC 49175]MCT2159972.1 sugar ABC transporter permease [Granulicatella adiacens]OFT01499.1 ABC transporter permease [Granulicatella sp. HMSC31F03]OFT79069.1 ABC transporter permease [Granulicatella sp. HMSC30F09]
MKNRRKRERNLFILVCLLPALILFFTFMIYPTIEVFRMSLFRWGGFSNNKEFVGLDNFKILWMDENFFRTMQNTILLIVVVTIFTVVLAVVFAAILSTEKIRGNNLFRIIFYIPNILSIVVIAGILSAVYDPKAGLLNAILPEAWNRLWLGDQSIVIYSLAFALIWQAIGYYMVMYMAGMANIPASLYEAADLDGAGKIGKFFNVTLPLIWNSIRTTLTFFIISTINLSFLLVQILTDGGPDGSTEVFLSYMFKQAYTNSSYGYGMAIGVVVFIFSFGLSGIVSHITKRDILEY